MLATTSAAAPGCIQERINAGIAERARTSAAGSSPYVARWDYVDLSA
jgi:hypothetical protein